MRVFLEIDEESFYYINDLIFRWIERLNILFVVIDLWKEGGD